MDNNIQYLFKYLGLNEDQTKVYLAALELGEASMQELAHKSGVKRTSIYNFIDELKDRKLIVTSKKRKRTLYSAVHPSQLIEIEKARLAELDRALPELLAIYNKSATKPKVTFYEGVDGIKEVLLDMLKEKQPVAAVSDYKQMAESLGDYYFDIFPPERARRGIISKNIVPDTPKAREFAKKDAQYLRETRFLPVNDLKTEINIYGNKVALNSYSSNPPFSVIIEDQNIAETLRTLWNQLWDKL
jgi:HTH-type transcriptional regulator, sugar sensing transcriptional regulator